MKQELLLLMQDYETKKLSKLHKDYIYFKGYDHGYADGYNEGRKDVYESICKQIGNLLPPTKEAIKECEEASKLVEKLRNNEVKHEKK